MTASQHAERASPSGQAQAGGATIAEAVRSDLLSRGEAPSLGTVAASLRRRGLVPSDGHVLALSEALRSAMVGLGPLHAVVADPEVTDVVVNGPGQVWVDRGEGMERRDIALRDETDVRGLATRLASQAGRRLDDAAPWVDAVLPGGIRLHAILPPLAADGTHISLRVLGRSHRTVADLAQGGALGEEMAQVVREIVDRRLSFLVTGGTGAGKTTVLAALLAEVPSTERIVVVEDSRELDVRHPHVVRLQGRPPNVEGAGAVTMDVLVRQALRMRPDRLVVGEVRGAEVADMLSALNTGHDGGCATVHANSPDDVPTRIEGLALRAGMTASSAHAQLASAVAVVLHVARDRGRRWVGEVAVLRRRDAEATLEPALVADRDGNERRGPAWSELQRRLAPSAAPRVMAPAATGHVAAVVASELPDRCGYDGGA